MHQSSIFGGAKPVDTTRREKEIEEKLKKPSHPDARYGIGLRAELMVDSSFPAQP